MSWIAAGAAAVSVGTTVLGGINEKKMRKRASKLAGQLTDFQTPQEVYDVLHATQMQAQGGLDPETLQYLTGNAGKALASGINTSQLLGGDANSQSALFGNYMNSIMQIGDANHQANLANFSKYLDAVSIVGKNKEAEWASKNNRIKDQIQAATLGRVNWAQTAMNGVNSLLGVAADYKTMQLWKEKDNGEFTITNDLSKTTRPTGLDTPVEKKSY